MIRKELKILVSQPCWRQGLESQVGPALHEVSQVDKSVQSQSVVPVVGQVGHKDADLEEGSGLRREHVILALGAGSSSTTAFSHVAFTQCFHS